MKLINNDIFFTESGIKRTGVAGFSNHAKIARIFEPAKAGFHHSAEMAGIPEAGAVSMLDNTPADKKKKEARFK